MALQTQLTKLSTWQIDPAHTHVEFGVRHMMVSTVKGRFAALSGVIRMDDDDPAGSSVEATIDTASIDTRNEQRDAHLRASDFLDVEQFPTIRFRSRRVEPLGGNRFRVTGDLTLHGVTREVTLDATFEGRAKDPWGTERVGFSARTAIDRRDFGLTWNQMLEAGGLILRDAVNLSLEIEAVRQS